MRYIHTNHLRDTLNNIQKQLKMTTNNKNIELHLTYHLNGTFKDLQKRDHTNSIIVLNVGTNDTRHGTPITNSMHTLTRIINKLKQQTSPQNIIILESSPSTTFDIHPFNHASFSLSRQMGVRFSPILVGEHHLYKDGLHVLRKYKHLMVKSAATAILDIDPLRFYGVARPPAGPNGPWLFPWGDHRRPAPTTNWPPLFSLLHHPRRIHHDAHPNFRNVTAAPPFTYSSSS